MQTNEIIDFLKNKNIQDFINANLKNKTSEVALKFAGKVNFNLTEVLKYLKLLQKAEKKLPEHYTKRCLLTPKSYEQSTSEQVATHKSKKLKCVKLLNLTGGLGVDDWAFSKVCDEVTSIDIDSDLNEIVNKNITLLGLNNVSRKTADAYYFVKQLNTLYDIIYLDPDRRDAKGRVYGIEDSEPDYFKLKEQLFNHTNLVIIKASPMIDITRAITSEPWIKEIEVIAEGNEVKELLLFIEKDYDGEVNIIATNISDSINQFSAGTFTNANNFSQTGKYFYEPNKAIIKAELYRQYANELGIELISNRAPYMVSNKLIDNYYGRAFKLLEAIEFKQKSIKKELKQRGIKKANIAKRNFRESTEELYKLTGVKDGGKNYLFFTTGNDGKSLMYLTEKA